MTSGLASSAVVRSAPRFALLVFACACTHPSRRAIARITAASEVRTAQRERFDAMMHHDVAELRERPKQLTARDCRRRAELARLRDAEERIRNRLTQRCRVPGAVRPGEHLSRDGRISPVYTIWAADAVIGLVGLVIFRRLLKN